MSSVPQEVFDAGVRLLDGKLEVIDYLQLLLDNKLINSYDAEVVLMLSSITGDPMTRREVADTIGSDLKYISRCVRRVTDFMTGFDEDFEDVALDVLGIQEWRRKKLVTKGS